MSTPERIRLSAHGAVNGHWLKVEGQLAVDDLKGTKTGEFSLRYNPDGAASWLAYILLVIVRCHIGAKDTRRASAELGQLLGSRFLSVREIRAGSGSMVHLEDARVSEGTLHSNGLLIGQVAARPIRSIGPLREVIEVRRPDNLISKGGYTLKPARGRPIRVRYTVLFRALHPSPRRFTALSGRKYRLFARVSLKLRKGRVLYHSTSRLRRL